MLYYMSYLFLIFAYSHIYCILICRSREDKRADQATTAEQIVDMFHNQGLGGEGNGGGGGGNDEGGADNDDDWL